MMPSPEAAPPPVLRPANQVRSQGVSLDIAAHGEEMVFRLDRERLEASLIHVAGTATVPMGMPPLRVREGKPSDKPRQFAVGVRPDHEVPMIRHQAPGKKVSAVAFDRLFENSLHRLVIGVGLKDGQACIATVENVIDHPAVRCSLWPSHGIIPVDRPHSRQEKVPDTFLPELYRGLGAVLLGGMLVSTLVTLVLVPLLLGLCFRLFPVDPPFSNAHAKRAASPI